MVVLTVEPKRYSWSTYRLIQVKRLLSASPFLVRDVTGCLVKLIRANGNRQNI